MKRIAVFCGSRPGRSARFAEVAAVMGQTLVAEGLGLVYGGGRLGLMGVVADAVIDAGGETIGVIPEALEDREQAHKGLTELIIVETMHERKRIMAERGDGFIAMPGGLGTLEELFEVWTWGQLGLHRKPLGLLNVEGFFDPLVELLDHMVRQEFVQTEHARMVHVSADPEDLVAMMSSHQPPAVRHWIQGSDV